MSTGVERYTERIDATDGRLRSLVGGAIAVILLLSAALLSAGELVGALVSAGIGTIGFGGVYLLLSRGYVVHVRDDGIYYRRPFHRTLRHLPVEEVTDVTWTEGTASGMVTREERREIRQRSNEDVMDRARESGRWFVPQRPRIKLVQLGCNPLPHGGHATLWSTRDVDERTAGAVRVDAANGSIYVFTTDHPRRFADEIDRASEYASTS